MPITIDGEEKRLGLALSGGGFRAAAFHLGVFRKLEQYGLLKNIDLISGVSGGSIAAAFLCANWDKVDVLDRLETYLSTRSIAVSSVVGGLLDPFRSRLDKLADSYDRHLFQGAKLSSLSAGPRLYLNATSLTTGNMFSFVAGGGKPAEMGDHESGFRPADEMSIARAVAASSAFPPVFPPLKLSQSEYQSEIGDYVTLTDGGVYDNLGINPFFRVERNQLDYGIASDGGKPFALQSDPTESGVVILKEALNILMEQVRGLQFSRMEFGYAGGKGPKPIWFSIDSVEGEKQEGDSAFASSISTNLKRLKPAEMQVLKRHGGALVEARLNKYAEELLNAN